MTVSSNDGNVNQQVFVTNDKIKFKNGNKETRIVLLCESKKPVSQEVAQRVAAQIAKEFKFNDNDEKADQIHFRVEEQDGDYKVTRANQQITFKLTNESASNESVARIQELSLKHLDKARTEQQKLSTFLLKFIDFISSPLVKIQHTLSSEKRAMSQEAKQAALAFGACDQQNLCVQMDFINNTLTEKNESLAQAAINGKRALKATELRPKKNEPSPTEKLAGHWMEKLYLGEKIILPHAAKNPHVLILRKEGDQIIIEDLCLANKGDKKVAAKTLYRLNSADPEFIKDLISCLKTSEKPSLSFLAKLFLSKSEKEAIKQAMEAERWPEDPVDTCLEKYATKLDSQPTELLSRSDDPLKMIYALTRELQPEGKKPLSKAEFYHKYVQQLILIYNTKADRLNQKERVALLKGLSELANGQLVNALSKEMGPVAAELVIAPLNVWLKDKTEGIGTLSKKEEITLSKLNSTATNAAIPLKAPLKAAVGESKGIAHEQISIDPQLMHKIDGLRSLQIEKGNAIAIIQEMNTQVDRLLNEGRLGEARLLSMAVLRAIPSANSPFWKTLNFAERKTVINALGSLSYRFSEAVALSGILMKPYEAFEIQMNIPLTIRFLLDLQCKESEARQNIQLREKLKHMDPNQKYAFDPGESRKIQAALPFLMEKIKADNASERKIGDSKAPANALSKGMFNGPDSGFKEMLQRLDEETGGQLSVELWNTFKSAVDKQQVLRLSPAELGYMILRNGGGGGFDLKRVQLFLNDTSLMIGGDPETQSRYNASKEVYDTLLEQKSLVEADHYNVDSNPVGRFLQFATRLNPELPPQEKQDLEARIGGVKLDKNFPSKELVPEEWCSLAACEQIAWVVTAPGNLLSEAEGNSTEARQQAFIQKMARMQRVNLAAEQISPDSIHLILENADGDPKIAIQDVNRAVVQSKTSVEEASKERQRFLGALPPRLNQARISDDEHIKGISEPGALVDAKKNSGIQDPFQLFKLYEAGGIDKDSVAHQQFSRHSVIHCFDLIFQFPHLLNDPIVQNRLLQVLADRNVLRDAILNNPDFFVKIMPVVSQMIQDKLGKHEYSGALFLMDLSKRIHGHALQIDQPQHPSIKILKAFVSESPYGIADGMEKLNTLFDTVQAPAHRALLASYIVHFYSSRMPQSLNNREWVRLLIAKTVFDRSPDAGHPATLGLSMQKLQERHLPYLTNHQNLKEILNVLVDRPSGSWSLRSPYCYQSDDQKPLVINIQTGIGFAGAQLAEEQVSLPSTIVHNATFRRVFPGLSNSDQKIKAYKRTSGPDTTYEFEAGKVRFKVIETLGETTIKLIQICQDKEFVYTETEVANPNSSGISKMVSEKGVWVNAQDSSDIQMPAKDVVLDRNSYHLKINKNEIQEISTGEGKTKKFVCADSEGVEYATVIQCRPREGILFLRSPESKSVDEIRFPEGLEIIKQDGKWRMKGNESFEWQLNDTADITARFDNDYHQWAMVFKHPETGEQMVWIWPQSASSTGKRGASLEFGPPVNREPIILMKQGQKETTTEAGWLYLAHLAYQRGNYGLAGEYLRNFEEIEGKPFQLPKDQKQINALRQVAHMVLQESSPASTAQKAFQLQLRLALFTKIENKLPLSQQKDFLSIDLKSSIQQMKADYDLLKPEYLQKLKSEGLLLTRTHVRAYNKLQRDVNLSNQAAVNVAKNVLRPKIITNIPLIACEDSQKWDEPFFVARPTKNLMAEVARNQEFFQETPGMSALEKAKNKAIREGIFEAAHELTGPQGFLELDAAQCQNLKNAVQTRDKMLRGEIDSLQSNILRNARHYAFELDLSPMVAAKTLDDATLMRILLDKFQDGEFEVLPESVRADLEKDIALFLIASTEHQQLNKALDVLTRLENDYQKDPKKEGSLSWILGSNEILRHLSEGSSRTRHLNNNALDVKGRRYLVTEYRSKNITRAKAKEAIEAMLSSEKKFVKVRMGLGKSTFIFPHLARFCMDKGLMPIVMFTEELLEQSRAYMDPKAYIFQFDRNYGIDPMEYASQKSKLGMSDDEIEIHHLSKLYDSLSTLQQEGRYPITTPQRRAALRNKKIELLKLRNQAIKAGHFEDANRIHQKVELLKKIEGVFKGSNVRELHDEDVNLDIARDYDYALEDSVKMDPINVQAAQELMHFIFLDPTLVKFKEKIVNHTFSAMTTAEFEAFQKALSLGMVKRFPRLSQVQDQGHLIEFLIGKQKEPPPGYPPNSKDHDSKLIAAFKTYLSQTLPDLYKSQDDLDRGLSESNGCVVVPKQEGKERAGNRFGNTKEALVHSYFYYAANGCSKEFFDYQLRELSQPKWSEKAEWKNFSLTLENLRRDRNLKTSYEAFLLPEAAPLRLQFLHYLVTSTPFYDINPLKISCNSQDIILGNQVNVASGTGDAFALNLTESGKPQSAIIEGETYLKMGLTNAAMVFDNPMDHIKEMVSKSDCHAIMIQGYSIGNDPATLLAELRQSVPHRQFVYPDPFQDNKLMMWLPGFDNPVAYDRSKINLDLCCNIYSPSATRGSDIPIKQDDRSFVVNMIGPGSKEEAVNQSSWRARQLGMGQKLYISFHKSMETRIRESNHLKKNAPILAGHVINDVKKESLILHARVKAAVFEAKSHMKNFAERSLSKPQESVDNHWESSEIPIAIQTENAMFEVYQPLFIKEINEDWDSQYGGKTELSPTAFYKSMYRKEIEQTKAMRQELLFKMAELFFDPETVNHLRGLPLSAKPDDAYVEQEFRAHLAQFIDKPEQYKAEVKKLLRDLENAHALLLELNDIAHQKLPVSEQHVIAMTRSESPLRTFINKSPPGSLIRALNLFQQSDKAADKAQHMLALASTTINPQFLNENLPDKISMDIDTSQGSQVQVQQQQMQQQQMQQQVQVQQIAMLDPGEAHKPPAALSIDDFIQNKVKNDLGPELSKVVTFHSKSPRAKALLDSVAQNPGQPLVYRLVLQDDTGHIRSCLVTASDYTESIGSQIERLKNQHSELRIGVYPLSNGKPPVLPPYQSTDNPPDQTSDEFVRAAAWDKLLLGWSEFSPEEKQYLEKALPNVDHLYLENSASFDMKKLRNVNDDTYRQQLLTAFGTAILLSGNRKDFKNITQLDPLFEEIKNGNSLIDFQNILKAICRLKREDQIECYKRLLPIIKDYAEKYLLVPDGHPNTHASRQLRLKLSALPQVQNAPVLQDLLSRPSQFQISRHEFHEKLMEFVQALADGKEPKLAYEGIRRWQDDLLK